MNQSINVALHRFEITLVIDFEIIQAIYTVYFNSKEFSDFDIKNKIHFSMCII